MGSAKYYFRREFQLSQFQLQHVNASDFYISSCQRNRRTLPLLCIRGVLFLACLGILITSLVMSLQFMSIGHWFIFMTHWGVITITLTTGFAFLVSCRAYLKGPIDSTFDLPWYVKTYWVLYNVGITAAFFITIYYYALLSANFGDDFAVDPVLDILIHGMNSVVMVILLLSSRVPSHILHFIHPVLFGIVYLLFSVIYYFAGGTDPAGNPYIYPTLDWGVNPLVAFLSVLLSAVVLTVVHLVVVAIATGRNALTRRLKGSSISITGSLPK